MKTPSPVLEALARRYERSQAGKTGCGGRDLLVALEDLLKEAGCSEGEKRAVAEKQLAEAEAAGILQRDPAHKRDRSYIHQIRFSGTNEAALYAQFGRATPTQLRSALAGQFAAGLSAAVPARWTEQWQGWCARMRDAALAGAAVSPFDREPTHANADLLALLPKLLAWDGESLVRFASCVLCGDSKTLESLAPLEREGDLRLRGKLGRLLEDITGGTVSSLNDLGILPTPRFVLVHGPLRLRLEGDWLDLGRLQGPFRLAQTDIERAEGIATSAARCLTVENETTFHELAKLQSGELLVCTSYPGSATVALLQRLRRELEYWHFGDSDEAGFAILQVLREKTGRDFRPLHMQPGRVPFEQEALGRPTLRGWPFYVL